MKDFVKCRDCKYFNAWRTSEGAEKHGQIYECSKLVISCPSPDDYCSKAEKKEEQNQKFGKWIPVDEGLPKEGESVIASTKYGVYPEARYTKEYGWEWAYEAGADYWRELEEVEAWMPLPKRYKPQESKEG